MNSNRFHSSISRQKMTNSHLFHMSGTVPNVVLSLSLVLLGHGSFISTVTWTPIKTAIPSPVALSGVLAADKGLSDFTKAISLKLWSVNLDRNHWRGNDACQKQWSLYIFQNKGHVETCDWKQSLEMKQRIKGTFIEFLQCFRHSARFLCTWNSEPALFFFYQLVCVCVYVHNPKHFCCHCCLSLCKNRIIWHLLLRDILSRSEGNILWLENF